MSQDALDLKARARRAMVEAGFTPDFPSDALQETAVATNSGPLAPSDGMRDLRALLWSSIDNDSSRDLDQIEYVEPLTAGSVRLLVGIADVEGTVRPGSAVDRYAGFETTSVYTGICTFPMLPESLSTDRTSLVERQDRTAMVIELHIAADGQVQGGEFYPALVRNRAKLAYSSTGAWLEGRGPTPAVISKTPGLEEQLRLQLQISLRLRELRKRQGALTFGSIEPTPVIQDGQVRDMTSPTPNAAQDLIESFMVAANVAMARFLRERGSLSLRRVVRTPKRWDRIQAIAVQFGAALPGVPDPHALSDFLEKRGAADPAHYADLSLAIVKLLGPGEYIVETPGSEKEGHFGLAVHDYTHSTAPNRRYADLITQRLLKATALRTAPPYAQAGLEAIAARCSEREDAARKVERLMRKVAAASLLSRRVGELFSGFITGASPKGMYVRLLEFPTEGRVIHGAQGIDVGDKVKVRLVSVDVDKGFIDFERVL